MIESASLHFVCYGQFQLSKIDPNLTKQQMRFRKGVFQSGQAFKSPIGGIFDTAGRVCLLGLIHTFEGPDITTSARTYIYEPYHYPQNSCRRAMPWDSVDQVLIEGDIAWS